MESDQLKCSQCKKRFNMDSRVPYILKCCLNTACKECVENVMMQEQLDIKQEDAEENQKFMETTATLASVRDAMETTQVINGPTLHHSISQINESASFHCAFCDEIIFQGTGINKALLRIVEKQNAIQKVGIKCDLHQGEMAEYFNKRLGKLVCSKCLIDQNKGQMQDLAMIDGERMRNEIEAALEKLNQHKLKVDQVITGMSQLLENDNHLSANSFIQI